jgi:hypothetical protein
MTKKLSYNTKRIDAKNYYWDWLEGASSPLFTLLKVVGKKEVVAEVTGIDNPDDAMRCIKYDRSEYPVFTGSYGTRLDYYEGGVEFEDGSCLICVGTSTWGGTFASHDNHEVRYYSLTLRKK